MTPVSIPAHLSAKYKLLWSQINVPFSIIWSNGLRVKLQLCRTKKKQILSFPFNSFKKISSLLGEGLHSHLYMFNYHMCHPKLHTWCVAGKLKEMGKSVEIWLGWKYNSGLWAGFNWGTLMNPNGSSEPKRTFSCETDETAPIFLRQRHDVNVTQPPNLFFLDTLKIRDSK